MNDQPATVLEMLERVDKRRLPETDSAIAQRIGRFRQSRDPDGKADANDMGEGYLAETMAFDFVPAYKDEETGWGTYYGPMMVFQNSDGQWVETPSIQKITSGHLAYWSERAKTSSHPILKGRYADLVWEFSKPALKRRPPVEMAHIVIDAAVEMANEDLCESPVKGIVNLRRALSLALSINDESRVGQLADVIMSYEDRVSRDTHVGLWGFSFDLLLKNKRIPLSSEQEGKILRDLELRLARLSAVDSAEGLNPFAVDSICKRLAPYYQGRRRQDDLERVLDLYADTYLRASEGQSPLVAAGWLQRVFKVLTDFGSRDRADEISHRIKMFAEASLDEMGIYSQKIKIEQEEIDKSIEALLEGPIEHAYLRLVFEFLPNPASVEEQLRDLAKETPMQFMMPMVVQAHDGRAVSHVGSIRDDLDGRIVLQMSQNMGFEAPFLNFAIEGFLAKYSPTAESIVDFLIESPLFDDSRRSLIERGVAAFLLRDSHAAACMIIPEIETAVRRLLEFNKGSIYRRGRGGGLLLRTLDQMLTDPVATTVLQGRGAKYLRVLLTDQRGWNLRNSVCHGLLPPQMFNTAMVNRLFHATLFLGLFREEYADGKTEESA